jgi:hypothetical protein
VVTNDLVMRSKPGTGDDSAIYDRHLNEPTLLYVVDGPVAASGYEWYLVQPFTMSGRGHDYPLQWVAAADKTAEAWIASASIDCNERPGVSTLIDQSAVASLACYGDRDLTFSAAYDGPDAVIPSTVSPSWLTGFGYRLRPVDQPPTTDYYPILFVHRRGDTLFSDEFGYSVGTLVRVTGHFDDRHARHCSAGPLPGETSPPPVAETVLLCRSQFVVSDAVAFSP